MRCQLIQTAKIDDHNQAEKEVLQFLTNLPEDYFVYREFKITPAYHEKMKGVEEQRPDFVVIAPKLGLVSIEVKDWNLTRNQYTWVDQYTIQVERSDGEIDEIHNPFDQISRYRYAFMELLRGFDVFVTSIVAFPRVSKAEFFNRLHNIKELQNPQSQFFVDLDRTIFKEDLDKLFLQPEKLLVNRVKYSPKHFPSEPKEITRLNKLLLPDSFRIGDFSKRQANREQLKVISEEQQRWIFDLRHEANYLLDVPGSGKTNALISKAIHIVDTDGSNVPQILITTYSKNLETNILRIYSNKISGIKDQAKYRDAITVQCVPTILESIVISFYEYSKVSFDELKKSRTPHEYNNWLQEQVLEILRAAPDQFKRFDYVLIDEIQDFDNFFLGVIRSLARSDNYFFVGDIGQKILDRSYDLQRLGIVTYRIELEKSYKMYRTPQHIAELAIKFITSDPFCQKEFEENGYKSNIQYPNTLPYAAEILRSSRPVEDLVARISQFLSSHYTEDDILIISSNQLIQEIEERLTKQNIPHYIGEPDQDGFIALVDFQNAKGLEREIVFVVGIEDLYERSSPDGLFWEEGKKLRMESFSRRMIYVAMTRTIEQLIIYYNKPDNRFITELCNRNNRILSKMAAG
jgi:hypothetical protein